MDQIINNKKITFIPNSVISFNDFVKETIILKNDVYEKYNGYTMVKGELIICNDVTKLKSNNYKIKRETYNEYIEFIKNYDFKKDNWIHNIIDGISEQEQILLKDEQCIIIPSFTFDGRDANKLHMLCIATDKTLRCLRDLESKHIDLLEHMKNKTISIICTNFKKSQDESKFSEHAIRFVRAKQLHFII
jgi:hypothetical protein